MYYYVFWTHPIYKKSKGKDIISKLVRWQNKFLYDTTKIYMGAQQMFANNNAKGEH